MPIKNTSFLLVVALISTLFLESGCARIFGGRTPENASGYGGGDPSRVAIENARAEVVHTLEAFATSGDIEPLCEPSYDFVNDEAIRNRLNNLTSNQKLAARNFIKKTASESLVFFRDRYKDLIAISRTPLAVNGVSKSAITIPGAPSMITFYSSDVLQAGPGVLRALLFHEAGHHLLDSDIGHYLTDLEATPEFPEGAQRLLDAAGACVAAYGLYPQALQRFVNRAYHFSLGRDPSELELKSAVSSLGPDGINANSRASFLETLTTAVEAKHFRFNQLSKLFLQRNATDAEMATIDNVVKYADDLEYAHLAIWLASDEFIALSGASDDSSIIKLYFATLLHRDPTSDEMRFYLQWVSNPYWKSGLVNTLAESLEFFEISTAIKYQDILGRDPSDSESKAISLGFVFSPSGLGKFTLDLLSSDEYFRKTDK